ncbi:MAG: YkgJ family cysteine cluster protein, partial [Nitrosopumilus sp.]
HESHFKVTIKNGLLQPNKDEKWCPFQKQNGLCRIYKKKPIGCTISPFNLTNKNTVIIRYRNLCMTCHKKGIFPAFKVFRKSLEIMFGKKETKRIYAHLNNGGGDIDAYMFSDIWEDLKYNINVRKKQNENK